MERTTYLRRLLRWGALAGDGRGVRRRRHRECGPHRKSAAELADRMAATTHDVTPDQMMAATEFLEAEWHDEQEGWDPETSEYCRVFGEMCELFASGYSPKDATTFFKDLVARLSGSA